MQSSGNQRAYPCERFGGIEERQLVFADALDVLDAEGEVIHGLEAEFLLERVEYVRHGGGRVVLEGFRLTVFQIDFHHVRHQGRGRLLLLEQLLVGADGLTLCKRKRKNVTNCHQLLPLDRYWNGKKERRVLNKKHALTRGNVVPLITTPSAKRTRDGLFLSLAFLAALSRADFRVDYPPRATNKKKNKVR